MSLKLYVTMKTHGGQWKHRKLYKMFNTEYNTDESGHNGNGCIWGETDGLKQYDLSDNKYKRLLVLFKRHGLHKEIKYCTMYKKRKKVPINFLCPGGGYEFEKDATNYTWEEHGEYEYDYGMMCLNTKFHSVHAETFITFYNKPVYD